MNRSLLGIMACVTGCCFILLSATPAKKEPIVSDLGMLTDTDQRIAADRSVCTTGTLDGILLPEGTIVTLQLFEDVSSKDGTVGQLIMWSAYKDVKGLNSKGEQVTIIAPNAYAVGKIKKVKRAGVFGRPGRIEVSATTVDAVDGQHIPLYCTPLDKPGKDRRALAWCLGIGLSIIGIVIFSTASTGGGFFLIAVLPMFLGLFISGKDVTLQSKSTLIEASVQRDIIIIP